MKPEQVPMAETVEATMADRSGNVSRAERQFGLAYPALACQGCKLSDTAVRLLVYARS
jgi:hypothetical protein